MFHSLAGLKEVVSQFKTNLNAGETAQDGPLGLSEVNVEFNQRKITDLTPKNSPPLHLHT